MKLSLHFDLDEFTLSQTAVRLGIRNDPPPAVVENLRRLARSLENVRALLGGAIIISSGYRSPELNEVVKGSKNSAHCKGLAADFTAPSYGTPKECALAITRSDLIFDQVIAEGISSGGGWVHFGLSESEPRQEVLTATFGPLGVSYSRGIA
jgi:zinc D-Ala-D-Ala carboxypeptidase